uniref:Multidrug transporter AcrB n=1 Tax=uncultured Alphaproteobacteria bacterium TaxID=91750 RepID=A0A6G8F1X8_9PROT|nr:multidrug transporter AcrB [uncultured Alphaproteobacteria bacterium]
MFNKIIEFSLKYRVLIIISYLFLLVYGIQTISKMDVDVFPDLNKPSVTLLVEIDGLAPEEMESLVLIPMENAINGATGVTRLYSSAEVGYGLVKAEFDWNTDVYKARQIINERISQIQKDLPENTKIAMTPISSIMGEVMLIDLTSPKNKISPIDLRNIAEQQIRKRLLAVSGVSSVNVVGGDVKQYQIILDTIQMPLLGITFEDVVNAIEASGINGTGGFLLSTYGEELIRTIGRPQNIEDLKNTVIAKEGRKGLPAITLGQIADIKIAPEPNKRGEAGINGEKGVLISIAKQPNIDTIKLTAALDKEISFLRKTLPHGVHLEKDLFKQSRFIQNAVDNISSSLLEGALLVAMIIFVFLVNFRGTLIVLTVIPCTLIMTAIVFKVFGFSINTMTLGGIAMALGSLVDDAIVDMQNIYKRLKENKASENPRPILQVVYEASKEVRNAIIFSTVLISLVFLPMFALQGIEGRIFSPLALSFILSMICSTVVALTLTPVMSSYLLPAVKALGSKGDTWLVRGIKSAHQRLLRLCFRFSKTTFTVFTVLVVLGCGMFFSFGKEFLPPFNEGSFTVIIASPPGTNLAESSRIGQIAEKALLSIPEVATTGRKQGRAELDEHALGVNIHEIEVKLKEDITRSREEIEKDIHKKLDMPGTIVSVGQPISHRIDFIISGVQAGLVVKIFGPNNDVLSETATQIEQIMQKNPLLTGVRRDTQVQIPQVSIHFDREKAARYGVQMQPAVQVVETALSGMTIAQMLENERMYDIVLRFDESDYPSDDTIRQIPITTVNGDMVALGTIADVIHIKGQNDISRENTTRRLIVQANFANRNTTHIAEALQKQISEQVKLPQGTFVQIDGQFKTQKEASRNILLLGIMSFVLVYGALYINFKSLNLATQLMISIPFAVLGGVIGVYFTSKVVSIATIIGMIALAGIAIRNGILLIDLYLRQRKQQTEKLSKDEIISLTQERLEPVIMTALTSIIGFVPLLLEGSAPGKEILYPVAVVIAFGLLTTTVLSLILTPILYNWRQK